MRNRVGRPNLPWDPEVSIEYETAASLLGDLAGICAARRWDSQHQRPTDEPAAERWRARIGHYTAARRRLTVADPAVVHQAIDRYDDELLDLRGDHNR